MFPRLTWGLGPGRWKNPESYNGRSLHLKHWAPSHNQPPSRARVLGHARHDEATGPSEEGVVLWAQQIRSEPKVHENEGADLLATSLGLGRPKM